MNAPGFVSCYEYKFGCEPATARRDELLEADSLAWGRMAAQGKLFCFGLGYSARALVRRLDARGWLTAGTSRSADKCRALGNLGIQNALFDGLSAMNPAHSLADSTHVLISVPPDQEGDPVLRWHARDLAAMPAIDWVGYLSTTGVYGDRDGDWVDESSDLRPGGERGRRRAAAEQAWLDWGSLHGKAVQIFRLAGIYGPGRSVFDRIRDGTARRIVKPGQVFSRIHVEDIATVLEASMGCPEAGGIYNVCDDEPAEPADVITYACSLCALEPPPEVPIEEAALSQMATSFWADNRRVRNHRIKEVLGVTLAFPDYRTGLRAIAGL